MLARAALGGIWIYQTYISPYKGFRCAHAVLHGGTGCSGYAKQVIKSHGLFRAIPLVRRRFQACRIAYFTLRDDPDVPNRTKNKKKTNSCREQLRDGCCDAAIFEGCDSGMSCLGRAALRPPKSCDADCDICSCG